MSSNLVPLKTCHVEERCMLNLSRSQMSSQWCSVEEQEIPFLPHSTPQTGNILEFNDYVTLDYRLPTFETDIDELINLSEPMNRDSDAENENGTSVKTVTFSNALHCLKTVKAYLVQQDVNRVEFSFLHKVEELS
ncbi:hypothetical protein TNCV_720411 [Trichonephila clavipes]|nr:hypothetical protein TNCV_720411 [Trichonephila clavipes]